jgi:hypothetical protein
MYRQGTGFLTMALAVSALLPHLANISLVRLPENGTMLAIGLFGLLGAVMVSIRVIYSRLRGTIRQGAPAMLVR